MPQSVEETIKMLGDHGPEAMLVAGGTDVYPKMKRKQFRPKALIGLRQLQDLKSIQGDHQQGMTIGAGVTLTEVTSHPEIQKYYAGLGISAGVVSTPVLRNMGTIGGNLCLDTRCNYYDQSHEWRQSIGWCKKAPGDGLSSEQVPCRVAPGSPTCLAASSTDTAPMLIALGAEITLVSPKGERRIPVSALFGTDGMNYLSKQRDELLTEIHIPPADGVLTSYQKLRRRGAFDFPVLGAAVAVKLDDDGNVRESSVALGGVDSFPIPVNAVQDVLNGNPINEETAEAAGQAAFKPARPMDNTDYHLYYRKKMVPVYVKRALLQAVGQLNS
jgi:4-hydroxybenzoyl-CoA reductase subunit beta